MERVVFVLVVCIGVPVPGVLAQSEDFVPMDYSASASGPPPPEEICTVDDQLIEAAYIKAVKRTILWKLRLAEPPENPQGPLFVREEQLQEYEAIRAAQDRIDAESTGCTEYNQYARTIRVFFLDEWHQIETPTLQSLHPSEAGHEPGSSVKQSPPYSHDHTVEKFRLKFEVNLTDADIVSSAELRLYKEPRAVNESHLITEERVEIYLVTFPQDIGQQYWGQELLIHVIGQNVESDSEGYVLFDVYEALEEWRDQDRGNLARDIELEVHIMCPDGLTTRYTPSIKFDLETPKLTQLVVRTYKDSDHSKRSAEDSYTTWCREHPDEFNCCLKQLQINFEKDFGWKWVIQPKSFYSNYCKGFCPYNWSPSTLHSVVMSRLIQRNPTAAPQLCCVPNLFSPLILYLHLNGTFHFVTLDDVQVRSCICR